MDRSYNDEHAGLLTAASEQVPDLKMVSSCSQQVLRRGMVSENNMPASNKVNNYDNNKENAIGGRYSHYIFIREWGTKVLQQLTRERIPYRQ